MASSKTALRFRKAAATLGKLGQYEPASAGPSLAKLIERPGLQDGVSEGIVLMRPAAKPWSSELRAGLALPPDNTAAFVQEVVVPAGTRIQRSRALKAFKRRGGAEQFELLDHIPIENFGPGVPLP